MSNTEEAKKTRKPRAKKHEFEKLPKSVSELFHQFAHGRTSGAKESYYIQTTIDNEFGEVRKLCYNQRVYALWVVNNKLLLKFDIGASSCFENRTYFDVSYFPDNIISNYCNQHFIVYTNDSIKTIFVKLITESISTILQNACYIDRLITTKKRTTDPLYHFNKISDTIQDINWYCRLFPNYVNKRTTLASLGITTVSYSYYQTHRKNVGNLNIHCLTPYIFIDEDIYNKATAIAWGYHYNVGKNKEEKIKLYSNKATRLRIEEEHKERRIEEEHKERIKQQAIERAKQNELAKAKREDSLKKQLIAWRLGTVSQFPNDYTYYPDIIEEFDIQPVEFSIVGNNVVRTSKGLSFTMEEIFMYYFIYRYTTEQVNQHIHITINNDRLLARLFQYGEISLYNDTKGLVLIQGCHTITKKAVDMFIDSLTIRTNIDFDSKYKEVNAKPNEYIRTLKDMIDEQCKLQSS